MDVLEQSLDREEILLRTRQRHFSNENNYTREEGRHDTRHCFLSVVGSIWNREQVPRGVVSES